MLFFCFLYLFIFFQDYKTYLDFVLALENRKEPAALQYIFKLLDMENQGYLTVFSLNYFFRVSTTHLSHYTLNKALSQTRCHPSTLVISHKIFTLTADSIKPSLMIGDYLKNVIFSIFVRIRNLHSHSLCCYVFHDVLLMLFRPFKSR